jgi:hypothetical protein
MTGNYYLTPKLKGVYIQNISKLGQQIFILITTDSIVGSIYGITVSLLCLEPRL